MKKDMTDLKKLVFDLMNNDVDTHRFHSDNARIINKLYGDDEIDIAPDEFNPNVKPFNVNQNVAPVIDKTQNIEDTEEFVEESLSLEKKEKEMIQLALQKHNGKRKGAAQELGISERTLYRKIKEYDIN